MLNGAAAVFLRLLGGSLCGTSHLAPEEEEEEEGSVGGLPQRRLESQARAEAAAKEGTINRAAWRRGGSREDGSA